MRFYKDHYDVVIIGGALAGMAAALQLQAKGVRDILILEKHNMPGGVATDYMRDGFEMEASLHEMMSIGPKGKRLKVGQFLTTWALTSTGCQCRSRTASSCPVRASTPCCTTATSTWRATLTPPAPALTTRC